MTSERWQHHNVTFTQRFVAMLVKSGDFSNICCIMVNIKKWGNSTFQVFLQSLHACNSRSMKYILMPF